MLSVDVVNSGQGSLCQLHHLTPLSFLFLGKLGSLFIEQRSHLGAHRVIDLFQDLCARSMKTMQANRPTPEINDSVGQFVRVFVFQEARTLAMRPLTAGVPA